MKPKKPFDLVFCYRDPIDPEYPLDAKDLWVCLGVKNPIASMTMNVPTSKHRSNKDEMKAYHKAYYEANKYKLYKLSKYILGIAPGIGLPYLEKICCKTFPPDIGRWKGQVGKHITGKFDDDGHCNTSGQVYWIRANDRGGRASGGSVGINVPRGIPVYKRKRQGMVWRIGNSYFLGDEDKL